LWAAELPGAFEVGSYRGPTGNTYTQGAENPKDKQGEITGAIKSIDRISGKIWLQDAKGMPVEFAIETNTRLQDQHLQISLDDLHLGDRVTVHYNVEHRLVNRIDRI
jgi:hypothetical protein